MHQRPAKEPEWLESHLVKKVGQIQRGGKAIEFRSAIINADINSATSNRNATKVPFYLIVPAVRLSVNNE
jgi:hypothetical protein